MKVPMLKDDMQKTSTANLKDDIQKASNASFDATNQSFERVTKVTQAIVSEIADYSKRSFEHGTKTMENLLGVKSPDKAIEVQSEYAKTAYEGYVTHASPALPKARGGRIIQIICQFGITPRLLSLPAQRQNCARTLFLQSGAH